MSRAPGPKGSLIWGSLGDFKADSLGFLNSCVKEHGDITRLRFGPVIAHLINHPDHIEHVLSRNARSYNKATRSASRIAATTGDSLLSANQDAWQRHRRLIQPAFQPGCFTNIDPVIDTLVSPMLERWEKVETIDIVDEMMQLVIAIAIKILFSSDIDPQKINAPLEILLEDTWRRIQAPPDYSVISPRFHRKGFKRAVAEINKIVFDLIQTRRNSADRPNDVLSRLLAAHEAEGETQLSDRELRDAAVTLLLAGHETTANALAWAFIEASKDQSTQKPEHIFAEAIRLHPSIWVIERRAIHGDTLAGYAIPRGSSVLISPFLLHRNPEFWPQPEEFSAARFEQQQDRPRHAYLPFGLGQHRCVGLHLANAIGTHVIKQVFARYELRLLPNQPLNHDPGITLRHRAPVYMRAVV